jgi:hypothetical protein
MTMRQLALLLLAALATGLAARGTARAEDPQRLLNGYTIETTTTAGYRLVDIDGSKDKYKEDYNLRSGGRLFTLNVDGLSQAPDTTPVDRFHLEVDTPGDEPVSHFRLTAADRRYYDLRADFTRSKYFYAVPQLFEQSVAGDVRLDDLHDFNLVRTDGSVDLTVHAPGLPTLLFGYRLYEREGDTVSTVRIPEGDTFLGRAPIDSVAHVGRLGTEFRALGTDVFLQQEYRRVNRNFGRHGPLAATGVGVDPTDSSTLSVFSAHQAEHIDIPATTVRLRRSFGDAVDVTGAYFYSHADLTSNLAQLRVGTSDTPSFSGTATKHDAGGATLDTHVADLGATVRLAEHVRLHTSYRLDERSENGNLAEIGTLGSLATVTGDQVRLHRVTEDIEVEPRPDLSLRAGVRYARRDEHFSLLGDNVATDTVGAVGDVRYRPWSVLDLFARYESAEVDDPLVTPGDPTRVPPLPAREVALTFTNRGRAGFRLEPRDWITLRYEFLADSRENSSFGARALNFGNSVALTVTPVRDVTVFAAYTRRDLDNRANILLAPLYGRTLSLQTGTEDVFVSELRYDFATLGQTWSTGSNVAYVNSSSTMRPRLEPGLLGRTSFDLDRVDGGTFLTWHYKLFEPSIEFRMIDYNERVLPRNDYRATILAFKVTKRFGL